MQQESTRPRRGLSLYMSILSAIAIEIFTFLEFPHTVLFFAVWTVLFALLTILEIAHETKRSKKPEEKRSESILPNGQKPLSIIDLDRDSEEVSEPVVPMKAPVKGSELKDRTTHCSGMEECFLVGSFAFLTIFNMILMVGVGFFGLAL